MKYLKIVLSIFVVFVIGYLLFKENIKESKGSKESRESKGSRESKESKIKESFLKPKFEMATSDMKFDFKKDLGIKSKSKTSLAGSKPDYSVSIAQTGNISGTAVLQDSQFNEGICISLEKTVYSTYTDENGKYSFQFLQEGNYNLIASMSEYISEKKENITVSSSKDIKIPEIVLQPNFDMAYPKIIRVKPERNSKNVPVPNSFGVYGMEKEMGRTGFCLSLDFSKPMNIESVEKGINFEPPLNYNFQWIGNKRLLLKTNTSLPVDPLRLKTTYKILFKEGISAIDEKKMVDLTPIEFSLGGFKVVETIPKNNSSNHPPHKRMFEIFFNSPVDRNTVNFDTFLISPKIDGKINFSDTKLNCISYSSVEKLPSDTKWLITLKKDIKDSYGIGLDEDCNLNFLTSPLKIADVWPKDNEKNVLTSSYPYIFFNTTVDKDSFKNSFVILPEIKGNFVWSADKNEEEYCNFVHSDYFNTNTIYKISISDNVVDLYGKKMQRPYSFSFKTESPRVSYMRPDSGKVNIETDTEVKLVFNTLMERDETVKCVSIFPLEEILFHWGSEKNYDILSIEPKHKWKSNTGYTFVVNNKAKDLNGNSLIKWFKGEIFTK
ncbi:MAG: Ig-like domain-containing protein [Candidatus Firestonebacteria bacterium]